MVCAMSAGEVMRLTRMGRFSMDGKQSGPMALLKRLKGKKNGSSHTGAGAQQMKMLRRLPKILRFIPGTAQDVRAYFLTLQYWLAGSSDNIVGMVQYPGRPLRRRPAPGAARRRQGDPAGRVPRGRRLSSAPRRAASASAPRRLPRGRRAAARSACC